MPYGRRFELQRRVGHPKKLERKRGTLSGALILCWFRGIKYFWCRDSELRRDKALERGSSSVETGGVQTPYYPSMSSRHPLNVGE